VIEGAARGVEALGERLSVTLAGGALVLSGVLVVLPRSGNLPRSGA
jgi:hypothetical protein